MCATPALQAGPNGSCEEGGACVLCPVCMLSLLPRPCTQPPSRTNSATPPTPTAPVSGAPCLVHSPLDPSSLTAFNERHQRPSVLRSSPHWHFPAHSTLLFHPLLPGVQGSRAWAAASARPSRRPSPRSSSLPSPRHWRGYGCPLRSDRRVAAFDPELGEPLPLTPAPASAGLRVFRVHWRHLRRRRAREAVALLGLRLLDPGRAGRPRRVAG